MLISCSPGIDIQSHKQRKYPPHAHPTCHMDREWCGQTPGIRLQRQFLRACGRVCTWPTIRRLFAPCLRQKKREFYEGRSQIDDASTRFQVASSKVRRLWLHCECKPSIRAGGSLTIYFSDGVRVNGCWRAPSQLNRAMTLMGVRSLK